MVGGLAIDRESLVIRHLSLVRVDPSLIISNCIGVRHSRSGRVIRHRHVSYVGIVERPITAPIVPVELRSVENDRILEESCPYATEALKLPSPSSVPEIVQKQSLLLTDAKNVDHGYAKAADTVKQRKPKSRK